MIYVYDTSISGCCQRSAEVELTIVNLHAGTYRLRNPARHLNVQGNATLVYTNDERVAADYLAAGVDVKPLAKRTTESDNVRGS